MRFNLTLPGLGGGSSSPSAPPPPAAPPPPPTQVDARKVTGVKGGGYIRQGAENIRNTGGGRGLDVMGTTSRALKSLTGQ